MRLYHHPFSSNARRAVMTALELNIALDLVLVDLQKREQRQPAFLARNPAGRVPVLEDGSVILPESHAIMLYLAAKAPDQTLYPADLTRQAHVHRWMFWCASHFQPAIAVLNWELFVKKVAGSGEPDPAQVARGEGLVQEVGALLEGQLASREWIAGAAMTLAAI